MNKSMSKIITTLLTLSLFYVSIQQTHAACSQPTAPDAPSAKPSLPICMAGYKSSGTHNCSSSETEHYIDEINKYMKKLNAYASDAITYANNVQAFARCSAEETKEGLK